MPSSSVMTWNGRGKASSSTTSQVPVPGDPVEGLVDQLLDPRPQRLDPAHGERLGHQLADAGVVRRIEVEDRPVAPVPLAPPNSSSRSANIASRISLRPPSMLPSSTEVVGLRSRSNTSW